MTAWGEVVKMLKRGWHGVADEETVAPAAVSPERKAELDAEKEWFLRRVRVLDMEYRLGQRQRRRRR